MSVAGSLAAARRRLPPALFVAAAAAAAALAADAALSGVRAGNVWRLACGVGAALLLLLTAAYGLRRRLMRTASRWRAGNAAGWLSLHLWGGGVFLLLVLIHSGFRLPSGAVTGWLWGLAWWTVLSGAAGRVLQRWIPRLLASGLATEVLYERIPELVAEIRQRAAEEAAAGHESIRNLYRRSLRPVLEAPRRRWLYFVDITGGREQRLREFRHLERLLGGDDRRRLERLEQLYLTKLEIDAHYTLQLALRLWPYLHVPGSVLLVALLAVHLWAVWAY